MFFIIALILMMDLIPISAMAAQRSGYGGVATNILEPVTAFSNFMAVFCLAAGAAFLFAGFMRYWEHVRNSQHVTLGSVIFLLLVGVCLMLIPFSYLVNSSIHFYIMDLLKFK